MKRLASLALSLAACLWLAPQALDAYRQDQETRRRVEVWQSTSRSCLAQRANLRNASEYWLQAHPGSRT